MAEQSTVVRTFIAIPLPNSVQRFLSDIQSELKSAGMTAAWPNPEMFHLTLKFLGPTRKESLVPIQSVMAEFFGAYPVIRLTAGGIGVFPDVRNARVVWSGIHGHTPRLTQLVTDLDKKLLAVGIPVQSRPFFPHITLARLKKPVRPRVLTSLTQCFENHWSPEFSVQQLIFYKSRLTPEGAKHFSLFQTPLIQ